MSYTRVSWLLAAAFAALVACGEQKERPRPYTSQCDGFGCLPPRVGSRLPPLGSGGAAGSDGNEGGEGGEVTLSGVVGLLADDRFDVAHPFPEVVDLRAESPRAASVVGVWSGRVAEPFSFEGVLSAPLTWVHAGPRSDGADALPTLQPLRTDDPGDDGVVRLESPLVLVRASVIDQIFSLASAPVLPDPSLAHVVLKLVKGKAREGIAGIEVTAPQAEVILYGVNGSFSDIPEESDESGLVVLGNLRASTWPGRSASISFSGERRSSVEVPVMTGSVTIVPIEP